MTMSMLLLICVFEHAKSFNKIVFSILIMKI